MTDQTTPTDILDPPTYLTTREALDAWLADGWITEDAPDWLTGGYVTKERAQTALRLLADQVDDLRARLDALEWSEQMSAPRDLAGKTPAEAARATA